MKNPLVTVIVLCYNHEKFVARAIESILAQNYNNIEIIVADDASNDDSQVVIRSLSKQYRFQTIFNEQNLGNCSTFNKALKRSKGEYVIDLAADDVLLPERVATGVNDFEALPDDYGVHFTDVELIDKAGQHLGYHFPRNKENKLVEHVPQGWIFQELLEHYFISPPSMMIKRKVLEFTGGYDEALSYEDFDFWIRSSRKFRYAFSDKILVKKSVLDNSLSTQQKTFKNKHIKSTLAVCNKAFELCNTRQEYRALRKRLLYEMKWAFWTGNIKTGFGFIHLFRQSFFR